MGGRSAKALAVLKDAGIEGTNVTGGILAWSREVDSSVPELLIAISHPRLGLIPGVALVLDCTVQHQGFIHCPLRYSFCSSSCFHGLCLWL